MYRINMLRAHVDKRLQQAVASFARPPSQSNFFFFFPSFFNFFFINFEALPAAHREKGVSGVLQHSALR